MDMKNILILWVLAMGSFTLGQSAKEIIQKNLEVSGGEENWNNLNSIQIEGEVVIGVGETKDLKIYHKRPNMIKVVYVEEGKEYLNEGYDGENGWTYDPVSKTNTILKKYQPTAFETDVLNYEEKGFQLEYLGKVQKNEKECFEVKLIKNKNETFLYFDTKTYYLLFEENDIEFLEYSDFRKVDDFYFPFKTLAKPFAGQEYRIVFKEMKINPYFEPRTFRFRKKT